MFTYMFVLMLIDAALCIEDNKAPHFLGNMTDNITAVYKQDDNIAIDLKQYVWDDQPVDTLSYTVKTKLAAEEFSLDKGVFIWNVGTGLRYVDTTFTFFVTDRLNASVGHQVTIHYCGCENRIECIFDTENSNSSRELIKAGCQCPEYFSGLYCETEIDPCNDIQCYQGICNMTFDRSSESWPCAPCPKGTEGEVIFENQICYDIDECVEGYSGDKCEHNCKNSDGSFNCSCRDGYKLNSNKYSCDDIEECEQNTAHCKEENTYCQNTKGSYECLCIPGYDNFTGICKKSEVQKYVGSMEITITLKQEEVQSLNKTIDTKENRDKFQTKLDEGFNGTEGYQSVEVLGIIIISTNRERRDVGKESYKLKANYIVTWAKTKTVDDTVSTALVHSFQKSALNKILNIGIVTIDLNTANFDVKSGNESGLCSFPDLINCDLASMKCIDVPGSFECECSQGFISKGSKVYCADADECQDSNSHQCSVHGKCRNTYGGFTCDCNKGFTLNDTDRRNPTCQDIDECSNSSYICKDGKCKNGVGNWSCTCGPGYNRTVISAKQITCTDINECQETEKYICYDGHCKNTIGGWDCICNETGYIRENIGTGFICSDIDECSNGSYICKDGKCKNSVGDWSCTCEPGYRKQNNSATNVTCEDIDECDQFKASKTSEERCVHGTCENKLGSWACNCPRNRTLQIVGNNSYDAYRCQGDYQYIGQLTLIWIPSSVSNKSVRTFVNKTITQLFLEKYNVSINPPKGQPPMRDIFLRVDFLNASFEDFGGAVKTKVMYVLHLGEVVNSEWVDEIQSYVFNLKKEFKPSDGVSVTVVNSTIFNETGINLCNIPDKTKCDLTSTVCNVHNGSFSCDCKSGYSRIDDHRCKEIDECNQEHTCSNGGTCVNTPGNWTCECPPGFETLFINETFIDCSDIDECNHMQGLNTCSNGGTCVNTPGNWTCKCPQGYETLFKNETFIDCSDIDECSNGSYICKDGKCKNSVGDWSCTCEPGYRKQNNSATNVTCEDIDECDRFKANKTSEERCVHGACENKPGSWACNCLRNRTWQSVGNNSYAVYRCQGDYQYIGQLTLFWITSSVSNKSVRTFVNKAITELFLEKYNVSITPPEGQPPMQDIFLRADFLNATFDYLGGAVKTKATYVLHLGEEVTSELVDEIQSNVFYHTKEFKSPDGVFVTVVSSTIFNETGINLCNIPDKTKCDLASTVCNVHNGSFSCDCKSGYSRIDDHHCKEIDECKQEQGLYICSNGGTCVNTEGNWTCECSPGYEPLYINETFINCSDIDECNQAQGLNTCSNGGTCVNTEGNWTCECLPGYKPLQINEAFIDCDDIDECNQEQGLNTCSNGGTCVNTPGNWTCECPPGFETLFINENCIGCSDIDECNQEQGLNTCSNGGTCVNTLGNWTCECRPGFESLFINKTFIDCSDIDECKTPKLSCIDATECKNKIGNWTCKCGKGQTEKIINETSKVCAGEYQYVASVSFTFTSNGTYPDNDTLKTAITNKVLNMYKGALGDNKVWVEILNISGLPDSSNQRRKRRSESESEIKADYIVHFDKQVKKDELDKVGDDSVNIELNVGGVTLKMTSKGIETKGYSAICDTKNNNCDKETSVCQSTTGKIECVCKDGYQKDDFSSHCYTGARKSSDQQTTVIAVGSSLSGLVIILCRVIFGVLRWKRKKIKEAEKITMHHESEINDYDDIQYIGGSRSEGGSLNEHRYSVIAIPPLKQNGDARSLNGHVAGNLYAFPHKPPKPHHKCSLSDLTNDDVAIYPSYNRRLSDQYSGHYFSHERDDFSRNYDTINDSGRFSPILDHRRQGAQERGFDRFQENRLPRQKQGLMNENDRPISPKPDYGRLNGNRRSRSSNPDYRWDERQERSNDSGVGNGDSNEYRRTEQRGEYPIGYRYSDTRF